MAVCIVQITFPLCVTIALMTICFLALMGQNASMKLSDAMDGEIVTMAPMNLSPSALLLVQLICLPVLMV